jgi:hypothetical protein
MANDFRIDLFSPAGVRFAQVNRFTALAFRSEVNWAGRLTARFNAADAVVSQLEDKSHVELYWRDKALSPTWIKLFGGIYRKRHFEQQDTKVFELTALDYKIMLAYRVNAFYANLSNKTKFIGVAAETIMKTLVQYNLTSSATTVNGRLRAGTNWPSTVISLQADAAGGNALDWYCAQVTILENLRDLALISGGDFDLIKTGTNAFQFRWYSGQRGTDKHTTVIFSVARGNMGSPTYDLDLSQEFTSGIIGGQGEDSDRDFATATGANYAAGNDIETFVAATQIEKGNLAGLADAGAKRLTELQAYDVFGFDILQTQNTQFGVHYGLGDLVSVVNPFTDVASTLKVWAVNGELQDTGMTKLSVEVGTP